MINPQWKREAIQQELDDLGTEKQKLSRWLLATELTSQAVRFINGQIEELTNKETRLQEQQWALEDQINELQKHSYDAGVIADQLKDFVCNFPHLQAGERKLLIDSLVANVKIGQNKRVILTTRSPFSFGYFYPPLAPRGEKPKVAEMRIYLKYDMLVYSGVGSPSTTVAGSIFSRKKYTL